MRRIVFLLLSIFYLSANESPIFFTKDDCVLFKEDVPEKGICTSNHERAMRLSSHLENTTLTKTPWGPFLITGYYKGERLFVACAPIGTGAGLIFTELFINGAKVIIRYGTEDRKTESASETELVKIIETADNLYGFSHQCGINPSKWGAPIEASPTLVQALKHEANDRDVEWQVGICHHLENYHALRNCTKVNGKRGERLQELVGNLETSDKPSSYDMETAVLFQVAKDFNAHAATILQTVNKESKVGPYEGDNLEKALIVENDIFFPLVFDALIRAI